MTDETKSAFSGLNCRVFNRHVDGSIIKLRSHPLPPRKPRTIKTGVVLFLDLGGSTALFPVIALELVTSAPFTRNLVLKKKARIMVQFAFDDALAWFQVIVKKPSENARPGSL